MAMLFFMFCILTTLGKNHHIISMNRQLCMPIITDISRMPSFISNYIAIPLMRKKRYPILLDKEGKITAQFPDRDNTATLIFVESLKIKNIKYLQSVEEIVQLLKLKQDN